MTTYNTGNPVGSAAAKDLYDNAENLDVAINSQTAGEWTDRLGNARQTWKGIEDKAEIDIAASASAAAASASAAAAGYRDETLAARNDAQAAASAIGPVKFYDTKAQADAAIGTMASGDIIEVAIDETRAGARTRYNVQAGALVFVVNLDQVRLDLANVADPTKNATMVGYKQSGAGAANRNVHDKLLERVSLKDFGAVGNGVADDTAAIQAAVDFVGANGGGIVNVPKGVYQTAGINLQAGVTLKGEGAYASVIRATSSSNSLVFMHASTCLSDIKLLSSVARTDSFHIDIQGNGVIVDNCEFGGYFIGVNVGTIGSSVVVGAMIKDCEFRDPVAASGAGAVQFANFSNAEMRNCILSGGPGVQPDFGVRYWNGDTAFLTDTNITLHGKALLIDPPAGLHCYAATISGCLFDSAGTVAAGVTVPSVEILPAGKVYNTKFSNCWFGLASAKSGCYIGTSGLGNVDGVTLTGCEFTDNGDSGLTVAGPGVENWIVTGGFSCANTNYGIHAAAGTSLFSIAGHRAGNVSDRGPNNIGINVDVAASNYYNISDCNVYGNAVAGIFDGGTGGSAIVVNNAGHNGTAAAAGVTVGPSPWIYKSGHSPETLYFAGGAIDAISLDGTIVLNSTGSTVALTPNQTVGVFYTDTPTVIMKSH